MLLAEITGFHYDTNDIDLFNITRCVLYYYRAHAAELGNPVPEDPLLFLKPVSSYVQCGGSIEVL